MSSLKQISGYRGIHIRAQIQSAAEVDYSSLKLKFLHSAFGKNLWFMEIPAIVDMLEEDIYSGLKNFLPDQDIE